MTRARDLADQADGVFSGDVTGTLTGTVNGLNPQASNMQPHNLIINGAMTVAQRGTSATVSDGSNEGYSTLDRWFLTFNSAIGGAVSFSQSTDAPDGFSKSLKVQCSTVDTSHTTNQYISVVQRIEAQDLQHLAYGTSSAKSMILSWRMKSATYSGPITVALQTQDGTSEYFVKSYAPTTSWAEYTCVIPPSTSATISSDNGEGLRVSFVLAGDSGSSIAASSDSTGWSTTRADYRSDVGNIVSNTSNEFYITGVQLEAGSTASPFAHENYGDTLQKCQRYYWRVAEGSGARIAGGGYYSTTGFQAPVVFPVTMRAGPTLEIATGTNYFVINTNSNDYVNDLTIDAVTAKSCSVYNSDEASGTAGYFGMLSTSNASAFLAFAAEL
jgi:hypothetical protein